MCCLGLFLFFATIIFPPWWMAGLKKEASALTAIPAGTLKKRAFS